MKVFLLGGYGKTGIAAARLLAQSDLVTQIAIAGRNLERAEKAATQIGGKAIPVHADGTDGQKLAPLLAGYDVIVNAAYNDTVLPIIRAAIHAGAHYCDLSWGDVLEPALQLGPEAETAGITAIIATGVSPCISNLMGVHAARQLEQVEQLQIGRADVYDFETGEELTHQQWLKAPKESLTTLLQFRSYLAWMLQEQHARGLRTVLDFQDGQWVEMDPIANGLDVPHLVQGTILVFRIYCWRGFSVLVFCGMSAMRERRVLFTLSASGKYSRTSGSNTTAFSSSLNSCTIVVPSSL
jgi:saccharopine dehydrogenase-like NADP-dependent oxidoreductase